MAAKSSDLPPATASSVSRAVGPVKPPKPSHLSSAFTGTLNSDAFREYVKAQKTGDTISSTSSQTEGAPDVWDKWRIEQAGRRAAAEQNPTSGSGPGRYLAEVQSMPGTDTISSARFSTARSGLSAAGEEEDEGTQKPKSKPAPPNGTASLQSLFNPPSSTSGAVSDWVASTQPTTSTSHTSTIASEWKSTVETGSDEEELVDGIVTHDRYTSALSVATVKGMNMSRDSASRQSVVQPVRHPRDESSQTLRPESKSFASPAPELDRNDSDALLRNSRVFSTLAPTETSLIRSARTSIVSQGPELSYEDAVGEVILSNGQGFDIQNVVITRDGTDTDEARTGRAARASELPSGRPARALFDIVGEASFNELSLRAGDCFEVLTEELPGGWSLAVIRGSSNSGANDQDRQDVHGLVPNGWYCYIQDFTLSPAHALATESEAEQPGPTLVDVPREAGLSAPQPVSEHLPGASSPTKPVLDMQVAQQAILSQPESAKNRSSQTDALGSLSAFQTKPDRVGAGPASVPDLGGIESHTPDEAADPKQSWLFTGRSLNPFSHFVTSGVEEYVHSNDASIEEQKTMTDMQRNSSADEETRHFVLASAHGPKWKAKSKPFFVSVHNPQKRFKMSGMHEYTVFSVTTVFPREDGARSISEDAADSQLPHDPNQAPEEVAAQLTVVRRFNQFAWLATVLQRRYPALLLPGLPEKQYAGRFSSAFIETRRADLQLWLGRISRHPVLRYDDALMLFLSEPDDTEWKKRAHSILASTRDHKPSTFFAQTWHPEFNVDAAEAALAADSLEKFEAAAEKAINGSFRVAGNANGSLGVLPAWKEFREGAISTSQTHKELSYALLRLIKGLDGAEISSSTHAPGKIPPLGQMGKRSANGTNNEHGAWCWREDCAQCVGLTKALQGTAECLQEIAEIHEGYARQESLRLHERLKDVSRTHANAQNLLGLHRATLTRLRELTGEGEDIAIAAPTSKLADRSSARCETVLNVTSSELNRIHAERVEDWASLGKSVLDVEIEKHERILDQLRTARANYETQDWHEHAIGGHVLPCIYESTASESRTRAVLPVPSQAVLPPGVAAAALRPVSLATELLSESLSDVRKFIRGLPDSQTKPAPQPLKTPTYHGTATIGRSLSSQQKTAGRSSPWP